MVKQLTAWSMIALLCGCGDGARVAPGGAELAPGRCGRGLVVVHSDYASTSVSILHADGTVAQPLFLSSASESVGLSAPLSGDVVVPTMRVEGPEVVLIDRRPAAVVSWVDLASGVVRAQLDVGTGFAANPQDYLAVGERAYVSRYDPNPQPGREPFDGGSDLLVIDPARPAVVDRIDLGAALADAPGFLPRPNRMVRLDGWVVVLLSAYDPTFVSTAASRLVVIDPGDDSIVDTLLLEGLHGCGALAIDEATGPVAVGCNGGFGGDSDAEPALSGVALIEIAADGHATERARWGAAELGRPAGFGLAFDARGHLWASTLGTELHAPTDDVVVEIDQVGMVSQRWAAEAFTLNELQCAAPVAGGAAGGPCGACFVSDAEAGAVQRFDPSGRTPIVIEDGIGLPPRYLGRL